MKSFQRTRLERTQQIDRRSAAGASTKVFASPAQISGPEEPQWYHTCTGSDQDSARRKQNESESLLTEKAMRFRTNHSSSSWFRGV